MARKMLFDVVGEIVFLAGLTHNYPGKAGGISLQERLCVSPFY